MKTWKIGVTIRNTFEFEAETEYEAREMFEALGVYDLIDCADFEIDNIEEINLS